MYLPLMAVLVDASTQERHALPLLAPGLDGAAQMLHRSHPQPRWSLLGLYDRDTLNHWLGLLRAQPCGPGEAVVIEISPDPAGPLEQTVPVVTRGPCSPEGQDLGLPAVNDGLQVFSRTLIEGFVYALDRLESRCMRCAA